MSIANKLVYNATKIAEIDTVKQGIKDVLINKGIDMTDVPFTEYAEKISLLKGEIVVLGVLGEPAENTQLTRYSNNSYIINPKLVADPNNGDYKYWVWDDTKWPYSEMTEVIEENNVFIKVPKMYIKLVKNNNIINERYFSNAKIDNDFLLSPAFIDHRDGVTELDYILISKYNGSITSNKMYSQSGKSEAMQSLANLRTAAVANNVGGVLGYQLFDMHVKFILETLYLVTFANTNSNSLFPQGSNGSVQNTGILDNFTHHTGYTTGLTSYLMKFMGIENYFSNSYCTVDGIKHYNGQIYVCNNPTQYNSTGNTTNYYSIGSHPTTTVGTIKEMGTTAGLFSIPISTLDITNYEKYYSNSFIKGSYTYSFCQFGRYYFQSNGGGLFYWNSNIDFSSSMLKSRLIKKPLK